MDGNGRWAKKKSLSRARRPPARRRGHRAAHGRGHRTGYKGCLALRLFNGELDRGRKARSWASGSSSSIFSRIKSTPSRQRGYGSRHSGSSSGFPPSTQEAYRAGRSRTRSSNRKLVLNFCLNYGGRQEIVDAVNGWTGERGAGRARSRPRSWSSASLTAGLPDVDLLIRTERRVPDQQFPALADRLCRARVHGCAVARFQAAHLYQAVYEYQQRERRFGGL